MQCRAQERLHPLREPRRGPWGRSVLGREEEPGLELGEEGAAGTHRALWARVLSEASESPFNAFKQESQKLQQKPLSKHTQEYSEW